MGIGERIELRHLRAFLAVAEELNFRAAAERMHLTQPPLTRTIGQLEDILGKRLFHRGTRRCELTDSGLQLLPAARKVMAVLQEELPRIADAPQTSAMRVGVCFALDAVRLPSLRRIIQDRLNISIDFEVRMSHELVRLVANEELDLALVLMPVDATGIHSAALATAQMMAALPATHPLASEKELAVRDLSSFDRFILMSRRENTPLFDHLHGELMKRGLRGPRYVQCREVFEGLAQISAGIACSLVSETLQGFTGKNVVLRPLRKSERIAVDIGLIAPLSSSHRNRFEVVLPLVQEFLREDFGLVAAGSPPA